MAERRVRVDLFAEDQLHAAFFAALIVRLSQPYGLNPVITTRAAAGGHGSAMTELIGHQRALERKKISAEAPDLLAVIIDGNCQGHQAAKRTIMDKVRVSLFPHLVIGCPDPHIERWCLADPAALKRIFGHSIDLPAYKCERGYYKNLLRQIIRTAGWPDIQEGREYAADIIKALDLSRPIKTDPSLADFISDLNAELLRLGQEDPQKKG